MFCAFRIFVNYTGHRCAICTIKTRCSRFRPDIGHPVFTVQSDMAFWSVHSVNTIFAFDGDSIFTIFSFDGNAIITVDADFTFISLYRDPVFAVNAYARNSIFTIHSDVSVFAVCSSFAHGYIVCGDVLIHHHINSSIAVSILADLCLDVISRVLGIILCSGAFHCYLTSQFIGHCCAAVGSEFQTFVSQLCGCIVDRILKVPDVGCIFQRIAVGILQWSSTKTAGYVGQLGTISTAFQSNLILVYRTVCILVILHSPVIQFLHITCTGNVFDCNRLNSCIRMISIFDFQVYLIIGHLIFTVAACFRIGNQAVVRLSCRCAGKSIIQFLQLVFRCRSSAYCSRIGDIPVFVIKAGDIALPGSIFAHDSCPRSNTVQPGHCLC